MRNFFKKAAFVLALAMVVSNIGSVTTASAAAAPSLKFKSRVVYVGGSSVSNYPDTDEKAVWIPSQNTEGYTVGYSWTSDLITVSKSGRIRTTGNSVGAAVVTVTYTPDNGGSAITQDFTVKVRKNATDVKLAQATIDALKIEEGLNVGEEVTLKAAKSGTIPVSYKTGNFGWDNYRGVVSDQVDYEVSDESIIKVEGNKLTAVGAGEAVLTVYTYEYYGDKAKHTQEAKYNITVIGGIIGIQQTEATKVKVGFSQELPKEATSENFLITNTNTKSNVGISNIDFADRKTITIETNTGMVDGAEYLIEYNYGTGDDKVYESGSFVATEGKVNYLKVNKAEVPYNYETLITVDMYDINDILVASVKESEAANYDLEWAWTKNPGVLTGDKLLLYTRGDKAELSVTYREYDENGKLANEIPAKFIITATDVSIDADLYYVVNYAENNPCKYDWYAVTTNASRRTYIYADKDPGVTQSDRITDYIHIYMTSSGKEFSQSLFYDYGYYLESSNEDILRVEPWQPHDHTQWNKGHFEDDEGIYAAIYGVKAGKADVLVKNSEGKTMKAVTVTVRAKSKFTSIELNKNATKTLSNTTRLTDSDSDTVEITVYDQYGVAEEGDYGNYISVELQSAPGGITHGNHPYVKINTDGPHNGLRFEGKDCNEGTYRYKVTLTKDGAISVKYITVTVREPKGTDSYVLEIGGNKDSAATTTVNYVNEPWNNGTVNKYATIEVKHYKGGIIYEVLPLSIGNTDAIKNIEIKYANNTITVDSVNVNLDGKSLTTHGIVREPDITSTGAKYYVNTVTGAAVQGNEALAQKSKSGYRSVKVTIYDSNGKERTLTGSFNVTDSQTALASSVSRRTVSLSSSTISGSSVEAVVREALNFRYGGKPINNDAKNNCIRIKSIKTTGTSTIQGISVSTNATLTGTKLGDGVSERDVIAVGTIIVEYKVDNIWIEYELRINANINVSQ